MSRFAYFVLMRYICRLARRYGVQISHLAQTKYESPGLIMSPIKICTQVSLSNNSSSLKLINYHNFRPFNMYFASSIVYIALE